MSKTISNRKALEIVAQKKRAHKNYLRQYARVCRRQEVRVSHTFWEQVERDCIKQLIDAGRCKKCGRVLDSRRGFLCLLCMKRMGMKL